jgi:hypothetical protein
MLAEDEDLRKRVAKGKGKGKFSSYKKCVSAEVLPRMAAWWAWRAESLRIVRFVGERAVWICWLCFLVTLPFRFFVDIIVDVG